jgi:hypothetical protein
MFKKEDLLYPELPPLDCFLFDQLRRKIKVPDVRNFDIENFKKNAVSHFIDNSSNILSGFDAFPNHDVIIGCQQYVDNLISKKGIKGLQIFEHDYHYYKKLAPDIEFVSLETLDNKKPLLMAMPFPGHLGKHRDLEGIIDRCNEKNIDVHLDCAWLVSAFDIEFNFDQPCIKSFGMSFSKAYNLSWNKVGIRWTREKNDQDTITILNNTRALSKHMLYVAQQYMEKFPIDHLCRTRKNAYFDICAKLKLRPANIIHACFSIDREKLYGLKNLLS